jgi:hypothetical protein
MDGNNHKMKAKILDDFIEKLMCGEFDEKGDDEKQEGKDPKAELDIISVGKHPKGKKEVGF